MKRNKNQKSNSFSSIRLSKLNILKGKINMLLKSNNKSCLKALLISSVGLGLMACNGGGGGSNNQKPNEIIPENLPKQEIKKEDDKNKENNKNEKEKEKELINPNLKPELGIDPKPNPKDLSNDQNMPMDKNKEKKWSGNFNHPSAAVPIFTLIENDDIDSPTELIIKDKEKGLISLQLGKNTDGNGKNNYLIYGLDNAYYGYYRDSLDNKKIDTHMIYSYDDKYENKGEVSNLTATYNGNLFYTTKSIPDVVTRANLELVYKNGELKGSATSRFYGDKLFDIKTTEDKRILEFTPAITVLDNSDDELIVGDKSPHKAFFNVNYINGSNGEQNKSIVGRGGNDIYWGVLGAEKQQENIE